MPDKIYITAQSLLEDSFRMAVRILESGFRPNFIIGVWRGGTPVGIAVQELFDYRGVKTDHIAIRTSSYSGTERRGQVVVHGLNYIIKKICYDDRVLIVDDFLHQGRTAVALGEIVEEAGGEVAGVVFVVEKSWVGGRRRIEDRGWSVWSLVSIKSLEHGEILFD